MKRVYIKTYGCQMNERDSEAVAAMLLRRGFALAPDEFSADAVLLNTCSVRELAESKAVGKAGHLCRLRKKSPDFLIGIMGCMAQNRGDALLTQVRGGVDLVVGTQQAHRIPEFLEELFARPNRGAPILALDAAEGSQEEIKDHLRCRPSAFISIQQGCDMRCSYCIVPKTRGRERSRSLAGIVAEATKLAEGGTKEITLLGQIVTSYGRNLYPKIGDKSPFVQLVEAVHDIEGIERVRFTSPHPHGFGPDLIDAFARLPKLCPFVHLPLQSGSNRVLKAMKRPYTRERYLEIVNALRAARPDISFCTDIIVGFPGETQEDFEQTAELFDTVKFEMAYIFKYSPRAGTPAAELTQALIPDEVMQQRNQILLEKLERYSLTANEKLVGTTQRILVEAPARKGQNIWMGFNPQHRKVLFETPPNTHPEGQLLNLKIERASAATLFGVME